MFEHLEDSCFKSIKQQNIYYCHVTWMNALKLNADGVGNGYLIIIDFLYYAPSF